MGIMYLANSESQRLGEVGHSIDVVLSSAENQHRLQGICVGQGRQVCAGLNSASKKSDTPRVFSCQIFGRQNAQSCCAHRGDPRAISGRVAKAQYLKITAWPSSGRQTLQTGVRRCKVRRGAFA